MSPFDSPQRTTETSHSISTSNSTSPSGGGGDVLLQWGQRKRSRVSRGAIEDSSSSVHTKQKKKISSHNNVPSKVVAAKCSSGSMPPPPPFVSSSAAASIGSRSRKCSPRNLEDPSIAGSESPSRNGQCGNSVIPKSAAPKKSNSIVERSNKRIPSSASAKCHKPSGSSTTQASERLNNSHGDSASVQSEHKHGFVSGAPAPTSLATNGDKVTVIQWPRIYISLSRKEKEDDFLAMKGTKIPQRPKKRAKNIDRTLQYCFPGMWLSDLTKSRYEVREKKSVKKQKHRGLKGLESLDSDSD